MFSTHPDLTLPNLIETDSVIDLAQSVHWCSSVLVRMDHPSMVSSLAEYVEANSGRSNRAIASIPSMSPLDSENQQQ